MFDYVLGWGLVWLFDFVLYCIDIWFVEVVMFDCYVIMYSGFIFFDMVEILCDCIDMDIFWYEIVFCDDLLW